jgi:hypothetical protein
MKLYSPYYLSRITRINTERSRVNPWSEGGKIIVKPLFMPILVFKTNVENMNHIRKLYPLFKTMQGILKWNVDTEDSDKILRVETLNVAPQKIEMILKKAGYYCKELED